MRVMDEFNSVLVMYCDNTEVFYVVDRNNIDNVLFDSSDETIAFDNALALESKLREFNQQLNEVN